MQTSFVFWRLAALAFGVALVCAPAAALAPAAYSGAVTHLGDGTAGIVVKTDSSGQPRAIDLILSAKALQSLPSTDKASGEWEYVVAMPSEPKTGFDHVAIDWNPHGHPPAGIYTVPHFDFHFYVIDSAHQRAIAFPKGERDPAARVSDARLIPPGYHVDPGTAVPQMGVHAGDPSSPEFHGKAFTTTFLYGYYQGRLAFVEPMITRAFLLSHAHIMLAVKTPAAYGVRGFFPTRYGVRYDQKQRRYIIELAGLRRS